MVMIKKKGAMAFKPKAPPKRPNAPGGAAASASTATSAGPSAETHGKALSPPPTQSQSAQALAKTTPAATRQQTPPPTQSQAAASQAKSPAKNGIVKPAVLASPKSKAAPPVAQQISISAPTAARQATPPPTQPSVSQAAKAPETTQHAAPQSTPASTQAAPAPKDAQPEKTQAAPPKAAQPEKTQSAPQNAAASTQANPTAADNTPQAADRDSSPGLPDVDEIAQFIAAQTPAPAEPSSKGKGRAPAKTANKRPREAEAEAEEPVKKTAKKTAEKATKAAGTAKATKPTKAAAKPRAPRKKPAAKTPAKGPAKTSKKRPRDADADEEEDVSTPGQLNEYIEGLEPATPRPGDVAPDDEDSMDVDGDENESGAAVAKNGAKRPAKRRRVAENNEDTVVSSVEEEQEATGRKKGPDKKPRKKSGGRPKRADTPSEAEDEEIDQKALKMGDLTKDLRIGKKFSKYDEIKRKAAERRAQVAEEKKKWAEIANGVRPRDGTPDANAEANQDGVVGEGEDGGEGEVEGEGEGENDEEPYPEYAGGPKMRVINGQIVYDESALQLDRHARDQQYDEIEEVEEDDFTRLVTSNTHSKRVKSYGWNEVQTEKFYQGLRMFGTDFEMISKMLPGRNRRQVKLKFNREEKKNPDAIKEAMTGMMPVDLEEYEQESGLKLEDAEVINAELERRQADHDAEEKRYDEEKKKAEEAKRLGIRASVNKAKGQGGAMTEVDANKQGPAAEVDEGPADEVDERPEDEVDEGPAEEVDEGPADVIGARNAAGTRAPMPPPIQRPQPRVVHTQAAAPKAAPKAAPRAAPTAPAKAPPKKKSTAKKSQAQRDRERFQAYMGGSEAIDEGAA